MTNVLIIGKNSFLVNKIIKSNIFKDKYNFIFSKLRAKFIKNISEDIDEIWYFGQPSENKCYTERVTESVKLDVQNIINLSNKYKLKIVFASSVAVEIDDDNYSGIKEYSEFNFWNFAFNIDILRIPRIYDEDKKTGLFYNIRNNIIKQDDLNKEVEYLDINDFLKQTYNLLKSKYQIKKYINLEKHTIKHIINRYNITNK